jgi:alcohol dehydrogenase class IV
MTVAETPAATPIVAGRVPFDMPRVERVLQGAGAVHDVPGELTRRGLSRAMVVTTDSVRALSAFVALLDELGDAVVSVFSKVEPHNPIERVTELIVQAREAGADVIVAIGGGSPVDSAKLAALGVSEGLSEPRELLGYAMHLGHVRPLSSVPLPIVAVPTTLSAAEWNGVAAFVDREREAKDLTRYLELTPKTIVLDPELASHTPRGLWSTTGVRAVDHAVETIYAKRPHPFTTWLAAGALALLAANLPRSTRDPQDLEAALQCQIAAWMSLVGVHNVAMGLSHAIGHQLGAVGVPHGVTSGITLPEVMRFLAPATEEPQRLMAKALADVQGDEGDELTAADRVERLLGELGVPRRVSEFDIPREKIGVVVSATIGEGAMGQVPRAVSERDIRELLERVW